MLFDPHHRDYPRTGVMVKTETKSVKCLSCVFFKGVISTGCMPYSKWKSPIVAETITVSITRLATGCNIVRIAFSMRAGEGRRYPKIWCDFSVHLMVGLSFTSKCVYMYTQFSH